MAKRDYYDVLGVSKTAPLSEIKSAYRKIAVKNHPDRNPGDEKAESRFKEATEAYEVLSNTEKRQTYDQYGFAGVQGEYREAQDFSSVFREFDDIFGNFSNIFDIFGGGGARSRRGGGGHTSRGQDVSISLSIDFRTLVFGGDVEIEYMQGILCSTCSGRGARAGSGSTVCPQCGGAGQVRRSSGLFSIATTCSHCNGSGSVIKEPCPDCRGQGIRENKRKRRISIPSGMEDGNYLTVRGEGHQGTDGSFGDLNIMLQSKPNPYFERVRQDLFSTIPITISQATLGCDIFIRTLDERKLKIKIPAGTQNGKLLRIRGEGIPYHGMASRRGDLYVELHVIIPEKLKTKQEKELFVALAEFEPENDSPKPLKRQ